VILSGSFTKPVFAEPGDSFVADYGPLGTVVGDVRFGAS